jgi:chemotaxis regulatin CheY-phosphate phosphatase CheZ
VVWQQKATGHPTTARPQISVGKGAIGCNLEVQSHDLLEEWRDNGEIAARLRGMIRCLSPIWRRPGMAIRQELTPLSDADYEAIESAVMETSRGRWFLAEFSRRNRTADTCMLLDAIARLEQSVGADRGSLAAERVRLDLMEMAKIIAQLKIELASDDPEINSFEQATEALDAVVRTTESATSNILEAAEQIQEIAWTLREQGASDEACDTLNQRAADIYTACSFQDLTAQRTKKVVLTMRSIEGRINGLMDAWNTGESPTAQPETTISSPQEASAPHRRHLYAPVRIPRHQLALDDIDLVMRGGAEGLGLMEEGLTHLPSTDPARPDEPTAALRHQEIDPDDIMIIDHAEPGAPLAAAEALPGQPPKASPPPVTTLAEIDALPADGKIRMFS